MNQTSYIEDWPAEQLKAAVVDSDELTAEQLREVRRFINRIGGVKNALLAIEMLIDLEGGWTVESPSRLREGR